MERGQALTLVSTLTLTLTLKQHFFFKKKKIDPDPLFTYTLFTVFDLKGFKLFAILLIN